MKLWYIAGEDMTLGDLVSIADDGTIVRYCAGRTLPAFAGTTRVIHAGELISFSADDDTDLRSRLTVEVLQG